MRSHIPNIVWNRLTVEERTKLLNYYRFMGYAIYHMPNNLEEHSVIEVNDKRSTLFYFPCIDPSSTTRKMTIEEEQKLISLSIAWTE